MTQKLKDLKFSNCLSKEARVLKNHRIFSRALGRTLRRRREQASGQLSVVSVFFTSKEKPEGRESVKIEGAKGIFNGKLGEVSL